MPDIITILISISAILIAIFGYWDNRKNISIILKKEKERDDIKEALKELKSTSDSLKNLPDYMYFSGLYDLTNDIFRELYENDTLKLTIEFQTLEFFIPDSDTLSKYNIIEYNENTINTLSLRKLMKKLLIQYRKNEYNIGNPSLNFVSNLNIISNGFVELETFFGGLIEIEDCLDKLNNFELLIESFDADIIKTISKYYEEILVSFASVLQKKVYTVEFERNIKPSEINTKIDEIFNVNFISKNAQYLSTEVASKIDKLRKELQILTYQ